MAVDFNILFKVQIEELRKAMREARKLTKELQKGSKE